MFTLMLTDTVTGALLSTATVTIREIMFDFENPQLLNFPESAGTVPVCVLLSGTVSQNTVVTVTSGQPGDTATGKLQ